MPLNIRDNRAVTLARALSRRRKTTMTEAVIHALQSELNRSRNDVSLAERLNLIAERAQALKGPHPRPVSKADMDDIWGH